MGFDLVGKFFHSFDSDGYVQKQGFIEGVLNEDVLVVKYIEWLVGVGTTTQLVWLREIVDGKWHLYDDDEEMRDSFEHGLVPRRSKD